MAILNKDLTITKTLLPTVNPFTEVAFNSCSKQTASTLAISLETPKNYLSLNSTISSPPDSPFFIPNPLIVKPSSLTSSVYTKNSNSYKNTKKSTLQKNHIRKITNIFFAVIELCQTIPEISSKNPETQLEATLKTIKCPFSLLNGSSSLFLKTCFIFSKFIIDLKISKGVLTTLEKATISCGLLVGTIELISETLNLARTISFSTDPLFSLDKLSQEKPLEELMLDKLQKFKAKYIENPQDDNTQIKLKKLGKRITPWAAKEIQEQLDPIITKLQNQDINVRQEGVKKAQELIKTMKTQYRKTILTHVIGLVTLGIFMTGAILSLLVLFNPFLLPAALILVPSILFWTGSATEIIRFYGSKGLLGARGWRIDGRKCIPKPIDTFCKYMKKVSDNFFKRNTVKPTSKTYSLKNRDIKHRASTAA